MPDRWLMLTILFYRKLLQEVSQGAKQTRRLVQELIQQIQEGPRVEGISFLDLKNRLLLR
jgi:hypothetical protein